MRLPFRHLTKNREELRHYLPFVSLSFGVSILGQETPFGKKRDRSFWKLAKPQHFYLVYFNVLTMGLTWASFKKDDLKSG
jgi:hypothetical protein